MSSDADNRIVSHEEVEIDNAVNHEDVAVKRIDMTEHHIGVFHGTIEIIRRIAVSVRNSVLTNFFGEFAIDEVVDRVRSEDLAAARHVTAGEEMLVIVIVCIIPIRTAKAFTDTHYERIVTNLFPFDLHNRSSVLEEFSIEVIESFRVEGVQALRGN